MLTFLLCIAAGKQQGIESDPTLSVPLPMTEYAVPASTFVSDLAKATGATLTCDGHIRDELIIVITKPRPAHEIMRVVAGHFGWRWTLVSPGAYKLEPTEKWLRIVRTGVAQDLLPDWQKARAAAKEYAAAQAKLNPRDLENEALRLAKNPADENGNIYQTLAQRDPFTLLSARVLAGLTDSQLTLLRNRRLVMSTSPGLLCSPIPVELQSEVERAVQDLCDLNQRMASYNIPQARFRAEDVAEVRFNIERPGAIEYLLLGPKRQLLTKGSVVPPRSPSVTGTPLAASIRKAIEAQKEPVDWTTDPQQPLRGFCELTAGIARALRQDFIGDAYDPYVRMDNTSDLWHALTWLTMQDGWLKMRARRWDVLRAQTVPHTLWSSLSGQLPQDLPLDEKAILASRLEEEQNRSPLVKWSTGDMNFYRFWLALPDQARSALRSGKPLNFASLPREVHEYLYMSDPAATDLVFYVNDSLFQEPEFADKTPLDNAVEGDSYDTDYAGIYPKWVMPGAYLQPRPLSFPVLYFPSLHLPIAPSMLSLDPEILKQFEADPSLNGAKPYLAQANLLRLRFIVAPGVTYERHEVEYKLGRQLSFDPATWPKELVARIKAAEERRLKSGDTPPNIGTIPP